VPDVDKPQAQWRSIDRDTAGQRVDNFLQRELRGVPRARVYRALRKGEVRVNRGRVKPDYRLRDGDEVRIPPIRTPADTEAPQPPAGLLAELERRVLLERDGLLVIDKPAGLAVHGGSGLSYGLIECLRALRPDLTHLALVHRLDRDTSGCLMLATRPAMLRSLHSQLRGQRVQKRYLALVAGRWPAALQRVEAPLKKNVLQSGQRMVSVAADGRPSVTEFRVLERFQRATLMEARPLTGRTHQIRVHARHAGHPVLGDVKYSDVNSKKISYYFDLKRLFLHASALGMRLPDEEAVWVSAPLEAALEAVLQRLRAGDSRPPAASGTE